MSAFAAVAELGELTELAPVVRRAVALDPSGLARLRVGDRRASILIRLPFDVLVSRTVVAAGAADAHDITVSAAELLAWLDGERPDPPAPRDEAWRSGVPPVSGWQRIDMVPDDLVRGLVRSGARTLEEAAGPDGTPSPDTVNALLDSVVLTVTADDGSATAELTLRTLSALNRMDFLPGGSHVAVDVAGRWIRVAGEFGSVYTERPGEALRLL